MSASTEGYWPTTKQILSLGSPVALAYLLQSMILLSQTVFVGLLGDPKFLAGATLGNTMANITGFSIGLGLTTCLDTLCSQAFGAKRYSLVGLYCQRAMALLTLLCIPLAIIWTFTEQVLLLIQIEPEVAALSGLWTRWLIIGLWPYLMFEAFRRYLQAQNIVWPMFVATLVSAVLTPVTCYLLVLYLDYGFIGAAVAAALSQWICFLCLILFTFLRVLYRRRQRLYALVGSNTGNGRSQLNGHDSNGQTHGLRSPANVDPSLFVIDSEADTDSLTQANSPRNGQMSQSPTVRESAIEEHPDNSWPSLCTRDLFRDWGVLLKLGVPGAVSVFIDWGTFEVAATVAGRLGTLPLAAHAVMINAAVLWYQIPLGLSNGTAVLLGNSLGARQVHKARRVVRVGLLLNIIYGLVNGTFFVTVLRRAFPALFTTDPETLELAVHVFPIMLAYGFWDATKCVCNAILTASGRPQIAATGNTISTILSLPLAFLFAAYTDWGLFGVWLSMILSRALATIGLAVAIARTDWDEQERLAAQRTGTTDTLMVGAVDSENVSLADVEVELASNLHNGFSDESDVPLDQDHEDMAAYAPHTDSVIPDGDTQLQLLAHSKNA